MVASDFVGRLDELLPERVDVPEYMIVDDADQAVKLHE